MCIRDSRDSRDQGPRGSFRGNRDGGFEERRGSTSRPGYQAERDSEDARQRAPRLPKDLDLGQLPRGVRAELRSLSPEKAEYVGGHLLMAGRLVDTEPELANQHAQAAKLSASRLPIVREAVGETAYAAGDYAEALSEFRALRRMTGTNEYLPAMADCERALGRTQAALKLIREGLAADPEVPQLVELRLVEAGVRAGSGHFDEAMRLLQSEIEAIGTRGTKVARSRLRYAYADYLEQAGQVEAAERWFVAAAALDPDETTDAADRVDRLRGIVIDFDDDDDAYDDDAEEDAELDADVLDLADQDEAEAVDDDETDVVAADTADDTDGPDDADETEASDGASDGEER
jgi:tetratricopeptide (TPR) repeat protein